VPEPFVTLATLVPSRGQGEALQQLLSAAIPTTHQETGCLFYALHVRDDGALVTVEKWASREALEEHLASPVMQGVREQLPGKLAAAPEVQTLYAVPLGDPDKGAV
jgi:quinol monooxygenase YgiN